MERISVLVSIDSLPSLDDTGSMSDGILTGGLMMLCCEETFSTDPSPGCIWMMVLLAALPLEADLFVFAVTRESVVSMGSVGAAEERLTKESSLLSKLLDPECDVAMGNEFRRFLLPVALPELDMTLSGEMQM